MTRFMISLEQGVDLVWHAFDDMVGGEIYVMKIPSLKITELASAIAPNCMQKIVGIRPGGELHEQMISTEDAIYTYEYKRYFKILPSINDWSLSSERIKDGVKLPIDFIYSSNNNSDWTTQEQLKNWIESSSETIDRY